VIPSKDRTEAGTVRKRAQKACQQCHKHKTKCSADYPRCKRCEDGNLVCEYVEGKRKFSHAPPHKSTGHSESQEAEVGLNLGGGGRNDQKPLVSPLGLATSPALTAPNTRRSSRGILYGEYALSSHSCTPDLPAYILAETTYLRKAT
jgi:hypothetical protein